MPWLRHCCGVLLVAASTVARPASAQPPAPTMQPRLPVVRVFAMPGFTSRREPNAAGASLLLDAAASAFSAITLRADAGGRCRSSLQAPASDQAFLDGTASAAWRVEVKPVSHTADEATFDVRWQRRVPRPGRVLQGDDAGERRVTMRDGSRGILDLVQAAPQAADVCDTFAIALELGFQSPEADVRAAGLAFNLWLVDRSGGGDARRTRIEARHDSEAAYAFQSVALKTASGPATLNVSGSIMARVRKDGLIDVTIDERHAVSVSDGFVSGDGRKRLPMRPGETVEFPLPQLRSPKLPADLRHDYALLVTTERLW
jgi:hypothetical protein